jgi:hypothetical protein
MADEKYLNLKFYANVLSRRVKKLETALEEIRSKTGWVINTKHGVEPKDKGYKQIHEIAKRALLR